MSIVTKFKHPKMVVAAMPLISFISQIKCRKYETIVDQLRYYDQHNYESQFASQRRMIPRISIAGNFKSNDYDIELINYSHFLFFEIPYIHPKEFKSIRKELMSNPYVFASFRNVMGSGICFIIKSAEGQEHHKEVFRRCYKYFSKKLNTKRISKDGRDLDHLVLMSSDEKAHLNIAAIPFHFDTRRRF
ncbi:MAG: BT4734/BF3469 family protein [Saprospiraceae bacterium]|nr:BT4734/BF3469 family protein [Saprospiraceae bacterium]